MRLPAGASELGRAPVTARAVWRPRWYVWVLLGLLALLAIDRAAPERLEGHWQLITPLVVVAGVWAARRLWETPPAATLCAAIALRIFSGGWSQIGLGGLPLDRLMIVFVLLQVFLRAPGAAHLPSIRLRNVHLLMALTLLYVLVSAVAAGTIDTAAAKQALLDEFGLAPYLAFLIAPVVFSRESERQMLLATLVGIGIYLGVTAIFEALGPHALVFPSYIAEVDAGDFAERVNGPFQGSVAEGCATFACGVAAAIAFMQWRGQRKRWLAGFALVVCAFATFATLERGVWIGAVVATVATACMTRTGRRLIVPGALVAILAVGAVLIGSSSLAGKASDRANSERGVWDRQNQIAAGLRMVEAKPLLGFGLERYRTDSLDYFRQAPDYPMTGRVGLELIYVPETIQSLHNLYLSYVVELGLVGATLWFVTLLWGVGGALLSPGPESLRIWKLGLMAIAIFYVLVTFVNPMQPPFAVMILWTWAGVALGSGPEAFPRRWARPLAARMPAWASAR
jgi:O-antigen ligase